MSSQAGLTETSAATQQLIWKDVSARDRPIAQDDWIRNAVGPQAKARWDAWLSMPRFRVYYDFAAWSVVVVAFTDQARGGALMQLLRQNLRQQRASAFAICRATYGLFRLNRLPLPVDASVGVDAGWAGAHRVGPEASDVRHADETGYVPLALEWDDPERRSVWETLLSDPRNWCESQCTQSFRSGIWLPELVNPNVDSGMGDFSSHSILGEEPSIAARPRAEHRHASHELNRRERGIAVCALREITRHGRVDVIASTQAAGVAQVAGAAAPYNWLCQASTEALPRRVQALAAAPVLLPLVLQITNAVERLDPAILISQALGAADEAQRLRTELDRVVDGGEPLFAWLARACHMSERTVRHLRKALLRQHTFKLLHLLSPTNTWRDFAQNCMGYLSWLDTLPVERWPQTPRQWRSWAEFLHAAERSFGASRVLVLRQTSRQGGGDEREALYAFAASVFQQEAASRWRNRRFDAPGWVPERDYDQGTMAVRELVRSIEMVAQAGHPGRVVDDVDDGTNDDGDFVDDRFDRARLCALSDLRADADSGYVNALAELRSWSMSQWHDAGKRWQVLWVPEAERDEADPPCGNEEENGDEDQPLDAQTNPDTTYRWLPLFVAADVPGLGETLATFHERSLVWLTSPRELAREGRFMQHCVISFTEECARQREHVASLRDVSGERQSTVRLRLHYIDGRWVPELLEHRARVNAPPSAACLAAVRAVMAAITQNVTDTDIDTDTGERLQARWASLEAARKLRRTARAATSVERHRESVAEHRAVLDQVLPAGMAAALGR